MPEAIVSTWRSLPIELGCELETDRLGYRPIEAATSVARTVKTIRPDRCEPTRASRAPVAFVITSR